MGGLYLCERVITYVYNTGVFSWFIASDYDLITNNEKWLQSFVGDIGHSEPDSERYICFDTIYSW